jgi:hypothetical protein
MSYKQWMQFHLEMGGVDTASNETKERFSNFSKLGGLSELKQFLKLIQKHNFFLTVCMRPIFYKSFQDLPKPSSVVMWKITRDKYEERQKKTQNEREARLQEIQDKLA